MNTRIKILFILLLAFSACKMQAPMPLSSNETNTRQVHVADAAPQNLQYPSTDISKMNFQASSIDELEKLPSNSIAKTKLKTSQKIELAIAKHILRNKIRKRLDLKSALLNKSDDPHITDGDIAVGIVLLLILGAIVIGILALLIYAITGGHKGFGWALLAAAGAVVWIIARLAANGH